MGKTAVGTSRSASSGVLGAGRVEINAGQDCRARAWHQSHPARPWFWVRGGQRGGERYPGCTASWRKYGNSAVVRLWPGHLSITNCTGYVQGSLRASSAIPADAGWTYTVRQYHKRQPTYSHVQYNMPYLSIHTRPCCPVPTVPIPPTWRCASRGRPVLAPDPATAVLFAPGAVQR